MGACKASQERAEGRRLRERRVLVCHCAQGKIGLCVEAGSRLSGHGKLFFRYEISSEIRMVPLCGQEEKPEGLNVIACISLTWESFSAGAIILFSYECKRALEIISFQSLLLFLMDSRMSWLLCMGFLHMTLGLNPAE